MSWNERPPSSIRKGIDIRDAERRCHDASEPARSRNNSPKVGRGRRRGKWLFIPLKRKATLGSQPVRLGLTPCLEKERVEPLTPTILRGVFCLRNQRRGLRQHLPAKRLKQGRERQFVQGLDGNGDNSFAPSGRQRPVVVCGDLNIAHTEMIFELGTPKFRGFCLTNVRGSPTSATVDRCVRACVGEGEKIYSWWSNRGQARAKDRGWRIDYFLLNPVAAAALVDCSIVRQGGIDVLTTRRWCWI